MAKRGRRPAPTARRISQAVFPVQVTRLHPLITARLGGALDLRRVEVLGTDDGYAVDIIVRNPAATVANIGPTSPRRGARRAA